MVKIPIYWSMVNIVLERSIGKFTHTTIGFFTASNEIFEGLQQGEKLSSAITAGGKVVVRVNSRRSNNYDMIFDRSKRNVTFGFKMKL